MDDPGWPISPRSLERKLSRMLRAQAPGWLLRDPGTCEDLVANVMTRLIGKLERPEPTEPLAEAYFWRSINHEIAAEIRRRARRREDEMPVDAAQIFGLDDALHLSSDGASPEQRLRARTIRQAIESCLQTLPRSWVRPATMKLLGYKPKEIARALELTPKSVEHLITRGRQRLRECLSQKGMTPS